MPQSASQVEAVEENVQVAKAKVQIIIEADVLRSLTDTPIFNAQQAGGPSILVSINKPPPFFLLHEPSVRVSYSSFYSFLSSTASTANIYPH